jgi:serine/threonine-protein kinase PknG
MSCGGTVEDGYCAVCGLAAAPVLAHASAAVPGSAGSASVGLESVASRQAAGSRGAGRISSRSARGRLGAGLVEIPPVPYRDPARAVLSDPQVPETRRFCGSCEQPVGRSRDGRAGLTEGFCRNCGARFSFAPKLEPGEMVAGQYEVLGCLAFGGLGWIYLARDRNVSDRWVVLKGLLNTGDADAMAAAVAERQFLAQVEHPNIVRIYNFVQHADRRTGEAAGYIVMEYVGGKSLKEILLDARRSGRSVPVEHAIAYMIEVLPALGYLHDRGLVYCDFKPDNVIQTEEQLKLIDMGGVRRIASDEPIYGTVGYQAPEIDTAGPSVSSDLFTVARALAVLTFEFKGYQGPYKFTFPDGVPLLAQQESFGRLLRRATNVDPNRRFGSAGEMTDQLTGVLREVLAVADGTPRPAFSTLFSPELQAIGTADNTASHLDLPAPKRTRPPGHRRGTNASSPLGSPAQLASAGTNPSSPLASAARLASAGTNPSSPLVSPALAVPGAAEIIGGMPTPQVDRTDPAAGYLATSAGLDPGQRAAALSRAVSGDPAVPSEVARSAETRLALARAMLDIGDYDAASVTLAELAADDPSDWRIAWTDGLRRLAVGDAAAASGSFSAVYDELPGEVAPKLALAFAAESGGDAASASRYFRLVWTVDRSYVSAAFGLARTCLAASDRSGAIAALAAVPETSTYYAAAQVAAVRILVSSGVTHDDLRQADGRLGRMALDEARRQQLTVEILRAALAWVGQAPSQPASGQRSAGAASGDGLILGCEANERALRLGLERGYRALARLTPDRSRRIELIDMANTVRPMTWA